MKKKKILAMLLSMSLAFSLAGCGQTPATGNGGADGDVQDSQDVDVQETSDEQENEDAFEEDIEEASYGIFDADMTVEQALEAVANYNGCSVEEMNYSLDDDGYVNFLGESFTDRPILSAEDAEDSIDDLALLAGAEGCEFILYRDDVSPVSGYTYYVFSQVASAEGSDAPISYSNSQIRIIADSEGNVEIYIVCT